MSKDKKEYQAIEDPWERVQGDDKPAGTFSSIDEWCDSLETKIHEHQA